MDAFLLNDAEEASACAACHYSWLGGHHTSSYGTVDLSLAISVRPFSIHLVVFDGPLLLQWH